MEGQAGSTQLFPECDLRAPMVHGLMAAPLMGKNKKSFWLLLFFPSGHIAPFPSTIYGMHLESKWKGVVQKY